MEDTFRPPPPVCHEVPIVNVTAAMDVLLTRDQGVVPNFANPSFVGKPVLVTAGICLPLVAVFASLRLYAKCRILKSWTLDDCKSHMQLLHQFESILIA